jgi:hypothetical protein
MKVILALMVLLPQIQGMSLDHAIPNSQFPIKMNKKPEPCCLPDQFEGVIGGFVGLQKGRLISDVIGYSYDGTNKRTNQNGISYSNGQAKSFRVLALYDENRQYIVDSQGDCKYYEIGDFEPSCVPDNATYNSHFYLGIGNQIVDLDQWIFTIGTTTVLLSVAPENCFIVSQIAFGTYQASNEGFMSSFGITNSTLGIKDPDVFTPPSNCEPGKMQNGRATKPFGWF